MPDWKAAVRAAIAHLNLEPARERSIVDEVGDHLSEKYEDLLSSGVSEEQACRSVLDDLNQQKLIAELSPVFTKEQPSITPGRDEPVGSFLSGTGKDILVAVRLLRQNPAFAIVAILSLALGIGANTAIFQLIDAVVLRTLPVPTPETLSDVRLIHGLRIGSSVSRQHEFSIAMWDQFRQHQQAFLHLAAWSTERFNLGHGGEARYADGMWVSGDFFQTLGLRPVLGRLFSSNDDRKGCGNEGAVISYSFWRSEFAGRTDVIGRSVSVNRQPFPVIGITPSSFSGLEVGRKFDVALPLCAEPLLHTDGSWTNSATTWWLAIIGRLKPGWTLETASAQFASIAPAAFAATVPAQYDAIARKSYLHFGFRPVPAATGVSPLRRDYQYPLYLLLAISGFVLLIGCANIANLMLARASVRKREMAVRLSLGASRARLVRQLLTESLLLALVGAVAGGSLACALSRVLIGAISTDQDRVFLDVSFDWRVLAFTTGVAIVTCVVFGLAPALSAAHTEPGLVIKTGGRGLTAGRERFVTQRGFIVSQMALSLVLVVFALLFVRTFKNLVDTNAGFDQEHIVVADFDASPLKLPLERRIAFKRDLLQQIRTTPGVIAAADTGIVPLSGSQWNSLFDFPAANLKRKPVNLTRVSNDYFRTLHIPMLAGRDFNSSDTLNSPLVAIVNETFAKRFLTAGAKVGATFGIEQDGGRPDKMYRVIGIVGDTKYEDLREQFGPVAFFADSQDPEPDLDATILVRSNEPIVSLLSSLKTVAARDNPEVVLNFSVLRRSIRESLGRERLMAALSGFYGVLAAILSIVGLYGIMSYTVVRRTSEIGIRMALGAARYTILSMIVREALTLLVIGLAFGIVLVMAAGHAVQSMLFGLKSSDPLALALAIVGMAVVAIGASLLPALRAANLQPMQSLREE